MPKAKQKTVTIDLTPTWSGILPALLALLEAGGEARATAEKELRKMADAADKWNAYCDAEAKRKRKGKSK
jgi:hypothetical protein